MAGVHIVTAGLNHKTAPVEVREQVVFRHELGTALQALDSQGPVREAAILSTCNRAEMYAVSAEPEAARAAMAQFFGEFHGLDPVLVEPHLYTHVDREAARHLFTVAAGIDSMILGEGQILSQVKQALLSAAEAGTARTCLNELFQRSLAVGKRARSETAIARGAVSVSSAAVDLAKTTFGDLRGRKVLIIGAGKMSAQTLKHLVDSGVDTVVVANRTFQRAAELAASHGGAAITFEDFPRQMAIADIIVSSSAAPHPIITVEKLKPHLAARRGRPLFIVDIAVPRDVETAVGDLDNVYLFDIDDLQHVTDKYRAEREKEVGRVTAMVDQETQRFMVWLGARGVLPVLNELRTRTEALRDAELERWLRKTPHLGEAERDVMRQMMRSFANKVLHAPLTNIRALADHGEDPERVEFVRRLFDLDAPAGEEQP